MSENYGRSVSLTRNSASWPLRPPFRVRIYSQDFDGECRWHGFHEAQSLEEAERVQQSLGRVIGQFRLLGYAIDDCNGQRLAGNYPVDAPPPEVEVGA